jgi:acetyltransferase-like isoleucine patch superfamily enzyme
LLRDHRPYYLKRAYRRLESFYVRRFIRPQLTYLGDHPIFVRPWHVELFGQPIRIGGCANVIAAPDMRVRLSVWSDRENRRGIRIGDYCLICPGVRLGSAVGISIGDSVMLAHGAYVTDSDWHGLYNRVTPGDRAAEVRIGDNAWVGDSAIVCKGVTIGRNSIIGAGSVVATDVPDNCIAAGNPAKVVKRLDPDREMVTRAHWFGDPARLAEEIEALDRRQLARNTTWGWLRHKLFPRPGD